VIFNFSSRKKKSLVRTFLNSHASSTWSLSGRYNTWGRDKNISKHWFKPNSHMFHFYFLGNLKNVTPRFVTMNKNISFLVPEKIHFSVTFRSELYLLRLASISHSSITSWISSQQRWLWTLPFNAATSWVKW